MNTSEIKPLGARVLIRAIEVDQTTASGLYIPDVAKDKPQEGEVIALGSGIRDEKGVLILDFTVKVGDRVLFSKYGGTSLEIEGKTHLLLEEADILGIIG